MVERSQTAAVLDALADTPAVLVVGPRQVGKSTLSHGLGQRVGAASAVTLDDVATRRPARSGRIRAPPRAAGGHRRAPARP